MGAGHGIKWRTALWALLAALFAAVAAEYLQIQEKRLLNLTQAEIQALDTAIDSFKLDNGHYPDDFSVLTISLKLHSQTPAQDGWGAPFQIRKGAEGVQIISAGRDGRFGTADDLAGELHPF
jgi:type II secretory pathway pseudopilin PulG